MCIVLEVYFMFRFEVMKLIEDVRMYWGYICIIIYEYYFVFSFFCEEFIEWIRDSCFVIFF